MESNNSHLNTNWKPCPDCNGLGQTMREPSSRRRRAYKLQLEEFESGGAARTPPEPPQSHSDICMACLGSGLESSNSITPINPNYPHVAIIGGGIGGVAFAVACLHRGIPFTLYERDESFDARSQGYGLTLQQASNAMAELGITKIDGGITSTRHVVFDTSGKAIGEWGMRKWKTPQSDTSTKRRNIHISRQSLRQQILTQLGDGESIQWGHKLLDFSEHSDGRIHLNFEVGGNTKTAVTDLVVGADGIRSRVRELIIGDGISPLQYLGCIVILGICPLKELRNSDSELLDSATVFQMVNGHERIYVMPYDQDTIMWQLSFPLDEKEAQELSRKGASAMKSEAIRRLEGWHDPIPQILANTPESEITGYPVYDRKLLDQNLLQSAGNVTLIGDSAHPMSPFKGQGANQAILDALSLARTISTQCSPDLNWHEQGLRNTVLNQFETEMIQRSSPKVLGSALAVKLLHSDAVLHEGDEPRGRGINNKK